VICALASLVSSCGIHLAQVLMMKTCFRLYYCSLKRFCRFLASVMGAGLLLSTGMAATYYIDFETGNDSNNGTSPSTPWKRHPFMASESVAYTQAAGDRFIFKGGVIWSNSFPFVINVSGRTDNRYYFGTTNTWGTGRAVFDGGGNEGNIFLLGAAVSNLTIADIEIRNHAKSPAIHATAPTYTTLSNLYIHKWWRGNATIDGDGGGIYNNYAGVAGGSLTEFLITHCTIKNPDGDFNFGVCVRGCGELAFSELGYAPELQLHGGYSVHDNEFHNNIESFMGDAAQHPNVTYLDNFNGTQILPGGKVYFYNNLIRDIRAGNAVQLIYPNLGTGGLGDNGQMYIFNNVVVNAPNGRTICIDNYGAGSGAAYKFYIWNNSFENTQLSGTIIGVASRTGVPAPGLISYFNNHFIGSGTVYSSGGTTSTLSGNNVRHTSVSEASAAGYAQANFYLPQAGGVTVGTGTNFFNSGLQALQFDTSLGHRRIPKARPSTGVWDIGAYMYGNVGPVTNPVIWLSPANLDFGSIFAGTTKDLTVIVQNTGAGVLGGNASASSPFSIVSNGSYSLGSNQSQVVTIRYSPSGTGNHSQMITFTGGGGGSIIANGSVAPVLPGLSFEAEAGTITDPFIVTSGTIYQTSQTGAATGGGRATYNFSITNAGDYVVEAVVSAPSDAENSFFVNIDAEPQDPFMVWQIPITTGFETRTVSWQGNGTWDNPQFVPKVFALTAGTHQLIIRGREMNTRLDRITIKSMLSPLPQPPSGLRINGVAPSP
jgi:hypothetical protein